MTTEKKKTPTWVWVLAIVVGAPMTLCTVAAVGAAGRSGKSESVAVPSPQVVAATPSPQPVEAAPEPEPVGPKTEFAGDGTFLVGKDIEPGTYRGNEAGGKMCYWTRLSGLSGEMGDMIANDIAQGPTVVTIKATDKAFETKRCGAWKLLE